MADPFTGTGIVVSSFGGTLLRSFGAQRDRDAELRQQIERNLARQPELIAAQDRLREFFEAGGRFDPGTGEPIPGPVVAGPVIPPLPPPAGVFPGETVPRVPSTEIRVPVPVDPAPPPGVVERAAPIGAGIIGRSAVFIGGLLFPSRLEDGTLGEAELEEARRSLEQIASLEEIPLESLPARRSAQVAADPRPDPPVSGPEFVGPPAELARATRAKTAPTRTVQKPLPPAPAQVSSPAPVSTPSGAPRVSRLADLLLGGAVVAGLSRIGSRDAVGFIPTPAPTGSTGTVTDPVPPLPTPAPGTPIPDLVTQVPIGTPAPIPSTTTATQFRVRLPTSQRTKECQEVKRKRSRGKCYEGFYEERRNKTRFTRWREVNCETGRAISKPRKRKDGSNPKNRVNRGRDNQRQPFIGFGI